ncbi:hypothetical protein KK062_26555, partial [Fulvivirgaceae bacterium PWU5]
LFGGQAEKQSQSPNLNPEPSQSQAADQKSESSGEEDASKKAVDNDGDEGDILGAGQTVEW